MKIHSYISTAIAGTILAAGLALGVLSAGAQTPRPAAAPVYGRAADNKIYAQQLVGELMAANDDLMSVGIHAKPPGGTQYEIAAHTKDLIGKKDSADDLGLIDHDTTTVGPESSGYTTVPRMVVHAPLRDGSGRIIGMIVLSFKLTPKNDKLSVHARTDGILSSLAAKLPDNDALFKRAS